MSENFIDDQRNAILATAFAFFDKGKEIQYDSVALTPLDPGTGGRSRRHMGKAPEYATKDRTLYTVCSSFCYEVYRQAIGLLLAPTIEGALTKPLSLLADETLVYRWTSESGTSPADALKEAYSHLAPCDLIVCRDLKDTKGHVMLYIGNGQMLHSAGGKYNMSTGKDAIERKGSIRLSAWDCLYVPGECYDAISNLSSLSVLRPLSRSDAAECKPLPAAKARVRYPRMRIERTASVPPYQSVYPGQILTYQIAITNLSGHCYPALKVTERIPRNTIISGIDSRGILSEDTITWNLSIAGGETVDIFYSVTVTGNIGETVCSEGGMVDIIPSNRLTHSICAAPSGITFYQKLPSVSELIERYFYNREIDGEAMYLLRDGADILVPGYLGGHRFHAYDQEDYVFELRMSDFMSGDLLIRVNDIKNPDASTKKAVFLSDGSFAIFSDSGKSYPSGEDFLESMLTCDLFFVLRPSLCT